MDIKAYESEIKKTEDTKRLREIMEELKTFRNDTLKKFAVEPNKLNRDMMMEDMYEAKTLTHQAKGKIMAIAHKKIVKPSFMR